MNDNNWELPLQIQQERGESLLSLHTVKEKNISDILESLIGACFNTKKSFECSWEFINKLNIVNIASKGTNRFINIHIIQQ